jgi:pilus assembly protein CpaB
MSKVILTDIKVLAAGTRTDQVRAATNTPPPPTTVVTLLVTPSDAERLALAASEGAVTLVLRNPLDTGDVPTDGTRLKALIGDGRPAPAPSMAPSGQMVSRRPPKVIVPEKPDIPPPYTVETIRAAKRSQETLQ